MGSHCSSTRHTRVIWPVVLKNEFTSPISGETLEKSPDTEAPYDKPNLPKRKRSSMDWEIRTPRTPQSEMTGERSSLAHIRNTVQGNDLDTIKEDCGLNDTNATNLRIGDFSPFKKTFEYKRGPVIDSNNSYAEVCECLDLNQGDRLAVKSYKIYGDINKIKDFLEEMEEEIAILQDLDHINLIAYYGIDAKEIKEPSHMIVDIIMEYASGGSVWGLVCKFNSLDERLIKTYTRQILEGLAYLHSEEILHGNLKSSNVLIDSNGVIKLTDVESINNIKYLLLENPQGDNLKDILNGSVYWTAPEILIHKKSEKVSDIWSVGCVVMEMLTGVPPWGMKTPDEAYKLLTSQKLPMFPKDISDSCRDFLQKIFKFDPEERPSIADLLEHPFLNEKTSDHSSVFETLQTLQSFNPQKGNNLLQSLNSLTQNADWNSNEKGVNNENQGPVKRLSRIKSPKENFLSRVFESNTEEECSPMERDEFGRNVIQKGRYFNSPVSQTTPKNENRIKKSKTSDLNPVREECDLEDNDKVGKRMIIEEVSEKKNTHISPFVPVKASIFRTSTAGEAFIEVYEEGKDESIDKREKDQIQTISKEDQRKALEAQLMRELAGIASQEVSEISENSQSLSKELSEDRKEIEGQREETEYQNTPRNSKNFERNKTRESDSYSLPFQESKSSMVIKMENLSKDYEERNQNSDERRKRYEKETHKRIEGRTLKNTFFRSMNSEKSALNQARIEDKEKETFQNNNEINNEPKSTSDFEVSKEVNHQKDIRNVGYKTNSILQLDTMNSRDSQEPTKSLEFSERRNQKKVNPLGGLTQLKSREYLQGSRDSPENQSLPFKIESMDSQKLDKYDKEQQEKEQRKLFSDEFQKHVNKNFNRDQSPTFTQSIMSIPSNANGE